MNTNVKIFVGVIVLLVVGVILTVTMRGSGPSTETSGKYDEFATCLKDKGAIFYGAWWCGHCRAQKELFGSSEKLLNYVECSNTQGNAQTQICIDKGINSYPTWEFADTSRLTGEVALETLAEKTACMLPGAETQPQ